MVGVELQLSNGVFQSTSTTKRTAPSESFFVEFYSKGIARGANFS